MLLSKLGDRNFYDYLYKQNRKNQRSKYNGNFVNNKILDNIVDYYNGYIVPNEIDANTAEIQYSLLKEFTQYKQLRTLFLFIKDYDVLKMNEDMEIINDFEQISLDELEFDTEDTNFITVKEELYEKIYYLYQKGGMEAVYSVFDFDDIYDKDGQVLVLK